MTLDRCRTFLSESWESIPKIVLCLQQTQIRKRSTPKFRSDKMKKARILAFITKTLWRIQRNNFGNQRCPARSEKERYLPSKLCIAAFVRASKKKTCKISSKERYLDILWSRLLKITEWQLRALTMQLRRTRMLTFCLFSFSRAMDSTKTAYKASQPHTMTLQRTSMN
jgi:hypothetical protein